MIQRFLFLMLLCASLAPAAPATETAKSAPPDVQTQKKPQKSPEELYLDGLAAIRAEDAGTAGVVLAGMSPASPYAKLLRAQIAALGRDFETPLRLLIPLQAEAGLLPQAYGSLHATLALAYESQDNVLGALEQRVRAEPYLETDAVAGNQATIWKLLAGQAREMLIEIRGESADAVVQGWIDLALAVAYADKRQTNIDQWRSVYPDHPAKADLLEKLAGQPDRPSEPAQATPALSGKLALLLPLGHPAYAAAAEAVQAGVRAALAAEGGKVELVAYAIGEDADVVALYRKAVDEGANFVIGPLTRDDVTKLASQTLTVPVLALNQPEGEYTPQPNLMLFGLQVETEARQVAQIARSHGMQSALVVKAATPFAERIAKAFVDAWKAEEGRIVGQLELPALEKRSDFKAEATQKAADIIFIAANADQAQEMRPWLDPAVPTYGTSHIYDGMAKSVLNQDLLAVHFIDLPWLVEPDRADFGPLRAPAPTGRAEMQRLYALGLDAYRLVALLSRQHDVGKMLLDGATGRIVMQENNLLTRELTPAQFRREGVVAEQEN